METKTLPSGATLDMTMAEFEVGLALLEAVTRELETIKGGENAFEILKNAFARSISSQGIKQALQPCFARCKYNNRQVNNSLFQDEKIREDYLLVVKEVLVYNLTPFSNSLPLLLKDIQAQAGDDLVSRLRSAKG